MASAFMIQLTRKPSGQTRESCFRPFMNVIFQREESRFHPCLPNSPYVHPHMRDNRFMRKAPLPMACDGRKAQRLLLFHPAGPACGNGARFPQGRERGRRFATDIFAAFLKITPLAPSPSGPYARPAPATPAHCPSACSGHGRSPGRLRGSRKPDG